MFLLDCNKIDKQTFSAFDSVESPSKEMRLVLHVTSMINIF